ncbi:hypothetical protein HF086_009711 [Spodoptera exigua]|uniref:Organic cation transporter protein-like n=1 Tax=Spodoptera exigua TaxID=7107 RepID=A0A922SHD8_SPOEX|nr:hypothetical protein HF086_009711 [Spodoptera exigua]
MFSVTPPAAKITHFDAAITMKNDKEEKIKSEHKINTKNEKEGKVSENKNEDKLAEEGKIGSSVNSEINSKEIVMDLETVLRELKIFGRYHLKLIFLLGMLAFGSMWHSTNYIFAVENYGYRCKHPNCGYTDLVNLELNSSFGFKCHKYKMYDDNGACVADNFNPQNRVCSEWVYERPDSFVAENLRITYSYLHYAGHWNWDRSMDDIFPKITEEIPEKESHDSFNLGCESWKRTLVGTMHSVGYMIGLFLVGPLSDNFTLLFVDWRVWVSYDNNIMLCAIESVTKEHRPIIIFLLSLFTTCGAVTLGIIAWLAPNWRIFLISIYAPALLFILYIFCFDESIRWLLNKGEKKKADDLIRKAAKMNNIVIDETKLSNLKCEENSANVSLTTLVKITVSSKKLLLRLICCICMWFTALFNAYSLLINSVSLEGNKYLNFELVALTGFPASVIILFLLMKCTRKRPLIFSFLLTGTFCTAHSILPKGYGWLSILLYVSGKLCSSVSIRIVYIYTSELFPTYTRNTMHALCSALGRIAAIVAPQTPLLLDYWEGLPSLIIGVLSVLTACFITLLPDTSDDVLPDNVCQAEAVGKKEKDICKLEKTEIGIDICSKL